MAILPIRLEGANLGERHKHLNSIVNQVYNRNVPFKSIVGLQELTAVDRLFKIDLASKYRNVDYIMQCLKDEDMLFVSRALKSTWLIEDPQYSSIINPKYLEEAVYPNMLTTAVSKMKNIIYLHLKDEARTQQFYEYYKEDNLRYALKFLPKCHEEYILEEMKIIPEYINPQYLKRLCENSPKAAELYFKDIICTKRGLRSYCGKDEKNYINKVKSLLKSEPKIFFFVIENFFYNQPRLSAEATKCIMEKHKEKYLAKPELYASRILNLNILAKYLNNEEIKELVIKLARAKYIETWFSYKNVEPLLKRIDKKEKRDFIKKIFSDKNVGVIIENPPYTLPAAPAKIDDGEFSSNASVDQSSDSSRAKRIPLKYAGSNRGPKLLNELFDKFRYHGFAKTFNELKKMLMAESSHNNRMIMMNVLVSKSGGKEEQVRELLEFLTQRHSNEPSNVRASVVRSLVRRAHLYRLSDVCWKLTASLIHDVPLEHCEDYVHAEIIHHALQQRPAEQKLVQIFLKDNISTMSEYQLTATERKLVQQYILNIFIENAKTFLKDNDVQMVFEILIYTLYILDETNVKLEHNSEVLSIVKSFVELNKHQSMLLLGTMYNKKSCKICRRLFVRQYFNMRQNKGSYLNALKHDTTILNITDKFKVKLSEGDIAMDTFYLKVSLYFNEGLAKKYSELIEEKIKLVTSKRECSNLARPLCILKGRELLYLVEELQVRDVYGQQTANALTANLHLVRPKLRFEDMDWQKLGALAAYNSMITLSPRLIKQRLHSLTSLKLQSFRRLALDLSFRSLPPEDLAIILTKIEKKEIYIAIPVVLRYIREQRHKLHPDIWEKIKILIRDLDMNKKIVVKSLMRIDNIPDNIKGEYCCVVYNTVKKMGLNYNSKINFKALNLILLCIANNLSNFDDNFVDELNKDFLELGMDLKPTWVYYFKQCQFSFLKILSKSLILCKNKEQQNNRFERFAQPVLRTMEKLWEPYLNSRFDDLHLIKNLNILLRNLKMTKVFMDSRYISPIPLYEKILFHMKQFMPVEKYLKYYIYIQLTMIYYISVRQCVKLWPETTEDRKMKNVHNIEKIGIIYGKYIGYEIKELVSTYFESIQWMYADILKTYIHEYFSYGHAVQIFKISIIKGLLRDKCNPNALLLAVLLYKILFYNSDMEDNLQEMFEIVKESDNMELKFYYNNPLYA